MNRFLALILSLLIATPALAGGGHESAGCEGGGTFLLVLLGIVMALVLGFVIYDAIMMKVSPEYRERAEEMKRRHSEHGGY